MLSLVLRDDDCKVGSYYSCVKNGLLLYLFGGHITKHDPSHGFVRMCLQIRLLDVLSQPNYYIDTK